MPFNDNPWGNPNRSKQESRQGPSQPSFGELFEKMKQKFEGSGGSGKIPSGFFLLPCFVLVIWLVSGVYTVKEAEQAVVTRFGQYHRTMGAGLHYHWPYPFEDVYKRDVAANNYLSSDDRLNTVQREQNDFYMLTGDENLVEMDKYTIHWRIKDLKKFLFNVRSPRAVILATADSALREVIAKTPINLIITERRAQVNEEVTSLLQALLDQYETGIHIVEFLMQKADPPEPVMDAFIDVTRAEADRERSQHESRAYRDEILPKARAKAKEQLRDAEGFAQQVVAKSEGDAGHFLFLLAEYGKAPEGTRVRLYMEMMEQVLAGANKVVIDPQANVPAHPYFQLPGLKNREVLGGVSDQGQGGAS